MVEYPKYSEYKPSNLPWLGKIPKNWDVWKITHGFDRIGSGTTPKSDNPDFYDGDTPWVTTSELRESVITNTAQKVTKEAIASHSALKVYPKGSIAIAMYGATIGRLGMLGVDATFNQACCVFAEPTVFDAKFVYYWLWMRRPILVSLSNGGGQPNLSQDDLRKIWIPAPGISEQETIARFLDFKTAQIDALIAKKKALLDKLAEQRTALISHAVTKGLDPAAPMKDSGVTWLGEIPAHWKLPLLGHIAEVRGGVTKGRKLPHDGKIELPYLRVANVQDGYLNLSEISNIEILPDELSRYSLRFGDVLMNEGGDNDKLGRGAVWRSEIDPCLHQNHVFAVRPRIEGISEWIALLTQSSYAKFYFFSNSKQSTNLASISSSNLKRWPVVLPPAGEVDEILRSVNTQLARIEDQNIKVQLVIDRLQEYRSALITNAVTGKIDVRGFQMPAQPHAAKGPHPKEIA